MFNSSNMSFSPYGETYWLASQVVFSFLFFVSFYIFFCLVVYVWKMKKDKKRKHLRQLLMLNILAVAMTFGRLVSDELVATLGWQADDYCLNFVRVSLVFYSASISPVYIVLWKRQHAFYANKQLQSAKSKNFIFLSYACLVLLVFGWIIITIIYLVPSLNGWKYEATVDGCRDVNDEQDVEIILILTNMVGGLGQIFLLGLLLYPLLKCKQSQKKSFKKRHEGETEEPNQAQTGVSNHNGEVAVTSFSTADLRIVPTVHSRNASDISSIQLEHDLNSRPGTPRLGNGPQQLTSLPAHMKSFGHRKTDSVGSCRSIITRKSYRERKITTPRKSRTERKRDRRLKLLIEKVFFLALICVLTDIIATILQLMLLQPELVYLAIFDVNLISNVLCISLSFEKWRVIFSPWRNSTCGNSQMRSRTNSAGSHTSVRTLTSKVATTLRRRAPTSGSSAMSSRAATPDSLFSHDPHYHNHLGSGNDASGNSVSQNVQSG